MPLKNKIILNELKDWLNNKYIDNDLFLKLSVMYDKSWDITIIIKWALILGSIILGIGIILFISLMINSISFIVFILSLLSIGTYLTGLLLADNKFKFKLPKTGNALVALSCMIFGGNIFSIAKLLEELAVLKGDNWPALLLIIAVIYFVVAYVNKNPIVLLLGLLVSAVWYGSESGYVSGWGAYYFGMNYPIRFAIASPIVILIGYLQKKFIPDMAESFIKIYYIIGLLYTNMSLWILSIFGSNDNYYSWHDDHFELLFFSIIWGICSVLSFVIGSRFQNKTFLGFAVTFFILNLYTRYFEYFWDGMNKAVFFIILGSISIGVGIFFERIIHKNKENDGA